MENQPPDYVKPETVMSRGSAFPSDDERVPHPQSFDLTPQPSRWPVDWGIVAGIIGWLALIGLVVWWLP